MRPEDLLREVMDGNLISSRDDSTFNQSL